jgi:Phage major tail protein 2.
MIAGKDGSVKLGENNVGYIDSFSININNSNIDITQLGKGWKEYLDGLRDWSGSFSGVFDYTDAAQKAMVDSIITGETTKVTGEFKVDTDYTLTGDIKLSSVSINAQVADKMALSINFVGDGKIAKKSV